MLCQYFTKPRLVTIVPAESFYPAPKVDSAVLCMEVRGEPAVKVSDEALFFRVVKAAFAQRRKTLLNCLSSAFGAEKPQLAEAMERAGLAANIRGERLGLEEFAALTEELAKILNK